MFVFGFSMGPIMSVSPTANQNMVLREAGQLVFYCFGRSVAAIVFFGRLFLEELPLSDKIDSDKSG